MRRLLVVLAAAALALAGIAAAKGPVQVCGAHGCGLLGDETTAAFPLVAPAGAKLRPAAAPAPYYVVRFRDVGGELGYWIPSARSIRVRTHGRAAWFPPTPAQAAALRRATRGVAPRPAPRRLDTVEVGYQRVDDPRGWLSLYSIGTPVASAREAGGWIRIAAFTKDLDTPWSDGANRLFVSRRGAYLRRDGRLVGIPPDVAERVRARLPLE